MLLAAAHDVVEVEECLLVADLAGERADLHLGRRQPRRPQLAQVVDLARARVLGEDRTRPVHPAAQHPARLLVVALRLERTRLEILALEHRCGRRHGKRQHQHGDNDGGSALRVWVFHLRGNSLVMCSPVASTSSTAIARGSGPTGQTGTHVPSLFIALRRMSATLPSTGYAAAGGPAGCAWDHTRYSTVPSRSRYPTRRGGAGGSSANRVKVSCASGETPTSRPRLSSAEVMSSLSCPRSSPTSFQRRASSRTLASASSTEDSPRKLSDASTASTASAARSSSRVKPAFIPFFLPGSRTIASVARRRACATRAWGRRGRPPALRPAAGAGAGWRRLPCATENRCPPGAQRLGSRRSEATPGARRARPGGCRRRSRRACAA